LALFIKSIHRKPIYSDCLFYSKYSCSWNLKTREYVTIDVCSGCLVLDYMVRFAYQVCMYGVIKCLDFPSVGVVEIQLVLALFASCVVLLNTAVKDVKEMTYFDTRPNAFQRRFSRHARRVEKVAQI
jgi:hypothetical protein